MVPEIQVLVGGPYGAEGKTPSIDKKNVTARLRSDKAIFLSL